MGEATALSAQLGEKQVLVGREGLRMDSPHTAGNVGSGKQWARCLGDILTVIWREAPDAFAFNCLN